MRGRAASAISTRRRSTVMASPSTASVPALRQHPRDALPAVDEGRPDAASESGRATRRRSALPFDVVYDYSYDGVMRSIEDSLQRLGLARIDIAYLHDVNPQWHGDDYERRFAEAIDGGYRALDRLRSEGVIRADRCRRQGLGRAACASHRPPISTASCWPAATRCSSKGRSTSSCRTALTHGIDVVLASPFNSGILASGAGRWRDVFLRARTAADRRAGAQALRHLRTPRRSARRSRAAVPACTSGDRVGRRRLSLDRRRSTPNLRWLEWPDSARVCGTSSRDERLLASRRAGTVAAMNAHATFEGFARPDGSVGVRNHVLVMSITGLTGPTARRIGRMRRRHEGDQRRPTAAG